jgi:hypothetical protein
MIAIAPIIYARGANGVPNTDRILADLSGRLDSYQHTIANGVGFESCTLTYRVSDQDPRDALEWLMNTVVVYGPEAQTIWEGFVSQVDIAIGGRQISASLDQLCNRAPVRYTLRGLGTPQVTAAADSTASQAIYGVKAATISVGTTDSTAAQALRDAYLATYKLPVASVTSTIAPNQTDAAISVTLTCAGWYTTLDWVTLERTDTSSESTTTQVGVLIGSSAPGIGATNAFLSTSTASIGSSGISDTRQVEADTPYRQKIEALLGKGTSSNQRLAWGVYEDRILTVRQWAGATPSTIGYRLRLGSAVIEDANGAWVRPWDVRPDAMVEEADLISVDVPIGAIETPGTYYLERVTCSVDGNGASVTLEPSATRAVDARIARLGGS